MLWEAGPLAWESVICIMGSGSAAGRGHRQGQAGSIWRLYEPLWINGRNRVTGSRNPFSGGYALGLFHAILANQAKAWDAKQQGLRRLYCMAALLPNRRLTPPKGFHPTHRVNMAGAAGKWRRNGGYLASALPGWTAWPFMLPRGSGHKAGCYSLKRDCSLYGGVVAKCGGSRKAAVSRQPLALLSAALV